MYELSSMPEEAVSFLRGATRPLFLC